MNLSLNVDQKCPVYPNFQLGACHCKGNCFNDNIPYDDFETAWKACGEKSGCAKIMQWTTGKFMLRKSNCKRDSNKNLRTIDFLCQGKNFIHSTSDEINN